MKNKTIIDLFLCFKPTRLSIINLTKGIMNWVEKRTSSTHFPFVLDEGLRQLKFTFEINLVAHLDDLSYGISRKCLYSRERGWHTYAHN